MASNGKQGGGGGGSQYEAGYVAFSTGIMGETRREIVKTRERTEGYEKDKNYSSFFFLSSFFFFLLRNSSSITSRILLPFSLPVISQYLTRLLIPKLRKLRELSTPSRFRYFPLQRLQLPFSSDRVTLSTRRLARFFTPYSLVNPSLEMRYGESAREE